MDKDFCGEEIENLVLCHKHMVIRAIAIVTVAVVVVVIIVVIVVVANNLQLVPKQSCLILFHSGDSVLLKFALYVHVDYSSFDLHSLQWM